MGLRIYNNVEAQNAHRQLSRPRTPSSAGRWSGSSSGLRINRAADDAAGLAVSEEMRTQIRGMNVASRNAQDGVSLVQVADGALGGVNDMLQRIRDLAVQAANGTLTDLQRGNLDQEVQSIVAEMARVASDTEFNGVKILSGSVATAAIAVTLQVGANGSQVIAFTIAHDDGLRPRHLRHRRRHRRLGHRRPSPRSTPPSARSTASGPRWAPSRTGSSRPSAGST